MTFYLSSSFGLIIRSFIEVVLRNFIKMALAMSSKLMTINFHIRGVKAVIGINRGY